VTRATETQHHGDEFVERNAWLHALLGLESWGRAFDALLDAHAPPGRGGDPVEPAAADARLVDFVLGLASLRATLGRHLAAASARAGAAPPARAVGAEGLGAEWLR
jgi:hypothetical protein